MAILRHNIASCSNLPHAQTDQPARTLPSLVGNVSSKARKVHPQGTTLRTQKERERKGHN